MKLITNTLKSIWKDEEAQGTAEYVLLIVVVVTLAFIFRGKILGAVRGKTDEIGNSMGSFKIEEN